jgi:hypothetical protein
MLDRRKGLAVIDSGTAGIVVSAAEVETGRTLAVLERQAATLVALRARLGRATSLAPSGAESDWHGPAQRLYELGLSELRRALTLAQIAVDDALRETHRAIGALPTRVG